MLHRRWLLGSCWIAIGLVGSGAQAVAQTAPAGQAEPPAVAEAGTQIEEVVVTAQKRAEKSQDVPVSIDTISANRLNSEGIQNVTDLGVAVPGLNITGTGNGITPFLRGVGNDASTLGNEASVAVYLDDVYQPRLTPAVLELSDINRIEVLKGPQGTLFGRNASGGLIAIYTRDPTQTPTAEVTLGYDNYNTQLAKAYIAGGITDTITADLSLLHSYQGSGWGLNYATGLKAGYENYDVGRTKWLFDLPDDTKFRLIADYQHSKGDFSIDGNLYPGETGGFYPFDTPGPNAVRYPTGFYDYDSFFQNQAETESYSVQGRLDHDFGIATFASITSFQNATEQDRTGATGATVDDSVAREAGHARTFTQEFQINSEPGSAFDWIVGLYYLNAFAGYEPTEFFGAGTGGAFLGGPFVSCTICQLNLYGTQRISDYSGYGQATLHVLPDTNVTVGVRYTVDDLSGNGDTVAYLPGAGYVSFGSAHSTHNFYKPTYKIALDHHFTSDIMGYLSYSRGFKSGTYNTLPLSAQPAAPEVLDAYEAGVKSELFDRRLQLNGSFFYYQIHNPQVQTVIAGAVNIVNAGAAEDKGVDLDAEYKLTPDLRVHAGAEYLDAHYTSYANAPFIIPIETPPYGTFGPLAGDATGHDLVRAPRFSYNVGLNYGTETPVGVFEFTTSYAWNSGFFWDPDNINRQHSYGLLDASLGFSPPDADQWHLLLYGKNLTAQKYAISELEQGGIPGDRVYPGAPLTFGIQLTYQFQGDASEPVVAAIPPVPAPVAAAPVPAPPAAEARRSFQVFFDFDRSTITDAATRVIQEAADAIKSGKVVQIAITGHTDTVGSAAYNQGLSERRAAAVATRLVADGVPAAEVTTFGVGKAGLLVPTADGVREPQNRRAEIVLGQDAAS